VSVEEQQIIEEIARQNIDFALFTLQIFEEIVLQNQAYLELITSDLYLHRTYSMGMVDSNNCVNFYDGMIRVIDPDGKELVKYHPREYLNHIAEHVEPWTYLKFPYLKAVGWKGLVDGPDSGLYSATPLSRLNVSDRMATPRAQEQFERFYETLGSRKVGGRYQPVHHRLATHWARLIELLYAAEHMLELVLDPEIRDPDVRVLPRGTFKASGGVGCVEAPRGTLTHHYFTDSQGILTKVNLVVGTTNNYGPMSMSLKRAAEELINKGMAVDERLFNRIEMAFRVYDPCLSCATHSLPGMMPLIIDLKDSRGRILQSICRD
jgi:F420-non-reducing hydrogenase large subunit